MQDNTRMTYLMDKFTALSRRAYRFWGEPSQLDTLFMSSSNSMGGSPSSSDTESTCSSCGSPTSEIPFVIDSDASNDRKNCIRVTVLGTALIALGCFLVFLCKDYLRFVLLWMEHVDIRMTGFVFVVLFIAVSFPAAWGYILLNLASGYLYGLLLGTLTTSVCALLGIFVSHVVTKKCFSEYVISKLSGNDQLRAILRVVESDRGFKVVVLARLTPIPFGLQNGLFAISNIRPVQYMSASFVGLLPTQVLNSYMGTTLRSMEEVLTDSSHTLTAYVVFFSQLILTAALSAYVVRRARIELNRMMAEHGKATISGHHALCNGGPLMNGVIDKNMNGILKLPGGQLPPEVVTHFPYQNGYQNGWPQMKIFLPNSVPVTDTFVKINLEDTKPDIHNR